MGLVPPEPGFLELLRERADATGALLVFDEVISGFRVARGGAQERAGVAARPDGPGQGDRRRAARRGLRRPADADGADRAGRRRLPGRHAVRQPARRRRRAGDAATARRGRLRAPRRDHRAARRGPARAAAGERPVQRRQPSRAADRLLRRRARARLRRRGRLRPRRLRRLVPRPARARRLPAASQFEAWFPSLAHDDERDRAHARGRRVAGVRGAAHERGSEQLAAALLREEGGLLADATRPPSLRRAAIRCSTASRTTARSCSRAVREGYLLHYAEPGASCAPRTRISRCWAAIACTRSDSRGSRRAGRPRRRRASSPT